MRSSVWQLGTPIRVVLATTFAVSAIASAAAQPPRVLPAGKLPADRRLETAKDLNGYFPFTPPATREAWEARAARVRRQLLVATGLWPKPSETPRNAVVHGKIDKSNYTVEKVYLESYPGHFVTGNLYRPKGRKGPFPAVLSPHGHFNNGRFVDDAGNAIRREFVTGAERFDSGRSPLQSMCVELARLGCVVFHYDMVGYADSVQLAHRSGVRTAMNTPENWGYFSPQAELHLQSVMGLQTYNSICALDFLSALPDVDPARIGVTGSSGGGTQTFILCGIDPRPVVAAPAVMVSTAMQGGCTCENACYLRVDTGNVEIAALFAPKPMCMPSADDWTKEIMTKGFPDLQKLYGLYGAADKVAAYPLLQFGHNYNYVSRSLIYNWFNKYLGLGAEEPVVADDFDLLSKAEMSVWDESHPKPPSGAEYERKLVRYLTEDARKQIDALAPHDAQSLAQFREVVGGAWDVLIGRGLPASDQVTHEIASKNDRGDYFEFGALLRYTPAGEELPIVMLHPKKWNKQVVIWAHEQGKAGLFDSSGAVQPAIVKLLASGASVVGLDLFQQGEFLTADQQASADVALVGAPVKELTGYAGYTFGYNHSLFARRAHDLLTAIAFVRGHEQAPEQVHLVGLDGAGPWAAAAAAQAGDRLDKLVVDTGSFRFAGLDRVSHPAFVPGAAKYGDLPALLALAAPKAAWLAGEKELPAVVQASATARGSAPPQLFAGGEEKEESAAVDWLLE